MKQIYLDTSSAKGKFGKDKAVIGFISVIFIVILIVLAGVGLVVRNAYTDLTQQAKITIAAARGAGQAAKDQDLEKFKSGLTLTRKELETLKKSSNKYAFLKSVPVIGSYVKDIDHAFAAGFAGLSAADRAIEALEPNADLLGLKGGSKFVSGSADERIAMAVKTMKALTPKINEMASQIDIVKNEIDAIDPDRYPEKLGKYEIKKQMVSVQEMVHNAANLFVNAQPLLTNLPQILGEPKEQRYLILFQNDKELRSTGGFITAYAQFRLVSGKIILEKADDIYTLDNTIKKQIQAPPEILKFHKQVYVMHLRDSNLSPDFKVSMEKFLELYNLTDGEKNINGIIAIDTNVLVEALKILGPMSVYGREFSAENDKRCDCPKAVYELEDYSTRPVNYVREARKDIIGVLLKELMLKALGVSPSQYWGQLFQMMLTQVSEKHILAYFKDPVIQKSAESFNMAGRVMSASDSSTLFKYKEDGSYDYLYLVNSNMAGAKSNMFVSEKITKDVTVNSDKIITTKLTIDYKNPYPGSDCGLESGGLCLNAPLRNWVRIFVPLGSKLTEGKGAQSPKDNSPQIMDTYESLNKTVFEGFIIVNPLGSARIELTYTSPVTPSDNKFRLLVQKQPGTGKPEYTIKLNGSEKYKTALISDMEFVW